MYRFFVEEKKDNFFLLTKETLNHLKSIRLKKDEKFICVFENKFYVCEFCEQKAKILEELKENHERAQRLVLFSGIINLKRFEWLIQKATELGVHDFYPLISKNTNPKFVEVVQKKKDRYLEIIKNASEQSFRNTLMKFHEPITFSDAVKIEITNKYIAHEKVEEQEEARSLYKGDCAFFIGPEGGFDEEEIKKAIAHNLKVISLGKRILRSETAALFVLSNVID